MTDWIGGPVLHTSSPGSQSKVTGDAISAGRLPYDLLRPGGKKDQQISVWF
jgi:hypothetical protein